MKKPYATELTHNLKDGVSVYFREILPTDKDRINTGFNLLSEESKYRRFFMANKHLSQKDLSYLTEVDQNLHVAWAATSEAYPALPGLGTCRFIRSREEEKEAEFAITILDDLHGMGLGTVFLALVYLLGNYHGLETLVATVLNSNQRFIERLKKLGGKVSVSEGITSILWPVTLDLHKLPNNEYAEYFKELIGVFHENLQKP